MARMAATRDFATEGLLPRMRRFLYKPWREKRRSFYFRWLRIFPNMPVPVRLPFGAWWLVRNDSIGATLLNDEFENAERAFVGNFLRPGMTELDIGAHHGYYSLLFSKKAGPEGKVVAFEPSPRERGRLALHLRINRCKNVAVETCALGEAEGTEQLYLADPSESGCNSLRKPAVSSRTELVSVRTKCLDRVLQERGIERVDFIKLDVEGAELSVLKGATELLHRRPRPVILAEVQDIRTRSWGYPAREIIRFLSGVGYIWFRPLPDGGVEEINAALEEYDGNFVAIPAEQAASAGRGLH
ncbi:MAG: FkbM family methyltransferase [Candidatus Acidiferrales bacterium]